MTPALSSCIENLPAMPFAVSKLSAMLSDEKSSVAEMASVLRTDPGLTGNLLRIANSASFRGRMAVVSVNDAIARLGARRVHELISCDWLRRTLPRTFPLYGERPESYWLHCVGAAVFTERILASRGSPNPAAFSAGLLHDVGKIVIAVALERTMKGGAVTCAPGETLEAAERRIVGTDHAAVGHALARRWSMPDEVAATIRFHHSPAAAPEPSRRLVAAAHLANALAHAFGLGVATGGRREYQAAALDLLEISKSDLVKTANAALEQVRSLTQALVPGGFV
jgi:HD-like signal output (HDOD) protein